MLGKYCVSTIYTTPQVEGGDGCCVGEIRNAFTWHIFYGTTEGTVPN